MLSVLVAGKALVLVVLAAVVDWNEFEFLKDWTVELSSSVAACPIAPSRPVVYLKFLNNIQYC